MATRTKRSPRPVEAPAPWRDTELAPPLTTEGQLEQIGVIGKRIEGYIGFMHKVKNLPGISTEAKGRAVALFHDRLAFFANELGRIQDNLQLE